MGIYERKLPTIRQLQYFLAVCEESGFRKAALKLGISQPSLSIQIKMLEDRLSTTLIFRNPQKFELTNNGIEFREKAKYLLTELSLFSESYKKNASNICVLGMTKALNFNFIPLFKDFLSSFSDDLVIYKDSYTSKELLVELQKETIDFAFISDYSAEGKNECHKLVHQEPLLLAMPTSHAASNDEFVDLNDVCDLTLYWFNRYQNPKYFDQCERVFKQLNHTLIRKPELKDTLAMLLNVSLGKNMALLPASLSLASLSGVIYKRLMPEYEKRLLINIFLVWQNHALKRNKSELIINYFNPA